MPLLTAQTGTGCNAVHYALLSAAYGVQGGLIGCRL